MPSGPIDGCPFVNAAQCTGVNFLFRPFPFLQTTTLWEIVLFLQKAWMVLRFFSELVVAISGLPNWARGSCLEIETAKRLRRQIVNSNWPNFMALHSCISRASWRKSLAGECGVKAKTAGVRWMSRQRVQHGVYLMCLFYIFAPFLRIGFAFISLFLFLFVSFFIVCLFFDVRSKPKKCMSSEREHCYVYILPDFIFHWLLLLCRALE